jgi:hypothetical protein
VNKRTEFYVALERVTHENWMTLEIISNKKGLSSKWMDTGVALQQLHEERNTISDYPISVRDLDVLNLKMGSFRY